MKFVYVVEKLCKVNVPDTLIYKCIRDLIIDGYINLYQSYGITNEFKYIKITPKDKQQIKQIGIRNVVENNIDKELYIKECIHNIITNNFVNDEKIKLLESIFKSSIVRYGARIEVDRIFCDYLVKQDLDNIEFDLSDFAVSTPLDEQTKLKLTKYILRTCFDNFVDWYQRWVVIKAMAEQLSTPSFYEAVNYAKILLHNNTPSVESVYNLGRWLGV